MKHGIVEYKRIIDYHKGMVTALQTLNRAYDKVTTDPKSAFHEYTPSMFNHALENLRVELDQQVLLALVASVEAMVRKDFVARVQETSADAVSVRFQHLRNSHENYSDNELHRIDFEAILDIWKELTGATDKIGAIKPLYRRRHWLAHGRYWLDKSGTQATPKDAQRFIDAFILAIHSISADFPRTN